MVGWRMAATSHAPNLCQARLVIIAVAEGLLWTERGSEARQGFDPICAGV